MTRCIFRKPKRRLKLSQGLGAITVMLEAALCLELQSELNPKPSTMQGTPAGRKRDNAGMEIEQLEQIAAVIVTAGLVAGNFLMFTPWRNGEDPRQRQPQSLMPQKESVVSDRAKAYAMQASQRLDS